MAKIFSVSTIALVVAMCSAQVPHGGRPITFQQTAQSLTAVHTIKASINVSQLVTEDALVKTKDQAGGERVGVEVTVNKDISAFQSESIGASIVYRLAITSEGALGMGINFAKFHLPETASLFVYNKDQSFVRGSFTSENHKENGRFAVTPVKGDTIIVEVVVPKEASADLSVVVDSIVHHYRPTRLIGHGPNTDSNSTRARRGFGDSGSCNVNVMCPDAEQYQTQAEGNGMILTGGGSRLCSGSMINNAAEDGRQYFLTAFHCGIGSAADWIIVFNYQSSTCANPTTEPSTADSVQGTRLVASNGNSDFGLLELSEVIPASYNVFLCGFDANNDNDFTTPFSISHPSGDIKKYARYGGLAVPEGYFSPGDTHWLIAAWDTGVTEGGSSGSPIYDGQGRIRGQLHGGYAACDYLYVDYYGRLSVSWAFSTTPSAQLAAWLDPERTGTRVVDGMPLNTARAKQLA